MINKQQLLMALKADLKSAEIKKRDLDEKIAVYKKEYDGKPYGNEVAGKSAIVSRDIKTQDEWQHASIIDPFVSTQDIIKCSPVTYEDRPAAEQNELVLNTQFCRQFNRYNFMNRALKVLSKEGTCVIQVGWDYEETEEEVEVPVMAMDFTLGQQVQVGTHKEKQTVIKKNQPTAIVRRNEDIYIDPTCMDDMDACQFVIVRYETNLSMLKQDGRFKNLDKITVGMAEAANAPDGYYTEDETRFRFKDEARQKIVVYEYWGYYDMNEDGIAEPIVCCWVNDVIIRMESNPYPDQKIPFIVVPFTSVPFQMQGETNAELLSDTQKVKTAILRGVIDNMAQSTNGQKGMKKGALDVANRRKFLNGENFEFNGSPADFWDGSFNQIPKSAFDMFRLMNDSAENMTGVRGMNANGSVGGGIDEGKGNLDATAARRLNIVRNVSENMVKPILRKWACYNAEFLEPEQVMRITNDQFVEIKRDDLMGNIDIDIQVSTNEDNAVKAKEIAFLLQTIGPNEDPGIRRIMMANIMRLHKMPDVAKQIEEYKPEPDPFAQQMQMLEMEKLKAEIAERNSRATENASDIRLKEAKADLDEAKARKTHSDADMTDLDFLDKESGNADAREMDKMQQEHLSKMDQQAMGQMHDERLLKMKPQNVSGPRPRR